MESTRARMRPENTALLAGVKDINWVLTYNRADIGDRHRRPTSATDSKLPKHPAW